jgi:hypothetical protein
MTETANSSRLRRLLLVAASLVAVATLVYYFLPKRRPEAIEVVVQVLNASQKPVPYAQVAMTFEDGFQASALTDINGIAKIRDLHGSSAAWSAELVASADGYVLQRQRLSGIGQNEAVEVSMKPIVKSPTAITRTKQVAVESGNGSNWGQTVELCSDPLSSDSHVIDAEFKLDAPGRECGLYAECFESSHSNSQVCWKFRIQGRGESSETSSRIKGTGILMFTTDVIQTAVRTAGVCHFYGQANQGANAWNHDDACTIPNLASLDLAYHQSDFICCGGGATSSATNANVPTGLEVRVSGGHYWSVDRISLTGDQFGIHTYCGPEPAPGPGCSVDVQVVAHYREPSQ